MKFAMSMIAVAGIAAAANAATSTLNWQVSVNGGAFATTGEAGPGDTVTFRLRMTGTGLTGIGGVAGFNMLPTLSNFDGSDAAVALSSEQFPEGSATNPFTGVINHPDLGTITNVYTGGAVRGPGNVGGTGRNAPFGSNGTNTGGVATPSVVGGSLQWTAAVIGNAGVSIAQLNQNNSGIAAVSGVDDAGTPETDDDQLVFTNLSFFSTARTNAIIFSYSVVMGNGPVRDLIASSAVQGTIQWFTAGNGASTSTSGADNIVNGATLHFVPAPGSLALLGLGGLVVARRRR